MKFYLVIIILVSELMALTNTFAQTEIEGEVSGEWTAEGSPYIVVDSTWIGEDDSLTVLENVTIQFEEDQGLYVFGTLTCSGGQNWVDQVFISVAEGAEHWKGLRFYGQNHALFEYTEIDCPDTIIFLDDGYSLTMIESRIRSEHSAIEPLGPEDQGGWTLNFIKTTIHDKSNMRLLECSFTAENSEFHHYDDDLLTISNLGGTFELSNCVVNAKIISTSEFNIVDCRIGGVNLDPGEISIERGGGSISNSYVRGSIIISTEDEGNLRLDQCFVGEDIIIENSEVEISNCEMYGAISLMNSTVSIRNSELSKNLSSTSSITTIDSCFLIAGYEITNRISSSDGGLLTVNRSVIDNTVISSEAGTSVNFNHNTFIYSGDNHNQSLLEIDNPRSIFTNNIFLGNADSNYVSLLSGSELPETFAYNCLNGFGAYALAEEGDIINLPETNIDDDPLFEWFVDIPFLTVNSPCINMGDPDSPVDPDGTRSDIGAFAFYYANSVDDNLDQEFYPTYSEISAYPNPFNNVANISFTLSKPSSVRIEVFNTLGRRLQVIANGFYTIGNHITTWDGSGLPSGDYLVRMVANGLVNTRKLTMIK